MTEPEPLATPSQIADYLSVSEVTLRTWARRQEGPPYIRVTGGTRRYVWTEVVEWLAAQKVRH